MKQEEKQDQRGPKTREELKAELERVKHKNRVYKHNMRCMQRALEREKLRLDVAQADLVDTERASEYHRQLVRERERRRTVEIQLRAALTDLQWYKESLKEWAQSQAPDQQVGAS